MIKSVIVTLFAFTGLTLHATPYPVVTPPSAEIQIFIDYKGFDNYAYKLVSYPECLVSAAVVYPSQAPWQNGACFKGDVYAAADLFTNMIYFMNEKNKWSITPGVSVEYEAKTLKAYLKVNALDANGKEFEWFPRISECIRWSTPEERALEPLP